MSKRREVFLDHPPAREHAMAELTKAMELRARLDAEKRLHSLLQEHKLMFVVVGGHAHEDRVVPVLTPDGQGITDEYDGILRGIVECVLGLKPKTRRKEEPLTHHHRRRKHDHI